MSGENQNTKNKKRGLQDRYRLIIRNDDTLEERASYQLTTLNIYILISSILFITALLVILLIVFTPIRRIIPGYGNVDDNIEFLKLDAKVQALETELRQQKLYSNSFKKMLTHDVETVEDVQGTDEIALDTFPTNTRIREDEILRSDVERSDALLNNNSSAIGNQNNGSIKPEKLYFVPPITGELSKSFEIEEEHYGVDIIAPKNTPVKSVLDGFVIASDWTLETGNTIGIQHANQIISFYKHNSVLLKKVGDQVKAGEAVAIIGNTGEQSSGPHLHFELWYNGKAINPSDYITFE
jgi:murein DD-endopeptidase MepM/ murein hydrolase activator NlpD